MKGSFAKFKKRLLLGRIICSVCWGGATGITLGAVALLLSKNCILDFEPIASIYFGLFGLIVTGGLIFLLTGRSDASIASELDEKFRLSARVSTMVEYAGQSGDMLDMQRRDAEESLSEIPLKKYKFKGLWVSLIALLLSLVLLALGVMAENKRGYVPPEEVEPFELTELAEAGLRELIKYVEKSALEQEFKEPMVAELESLLEDLKSITTLPEMQTRLTEAMAVLVDITYASSTSTEILNALWDSGEINLRYLAITLYGGDGSKADWGDFAEGLAEYIGVLLGDAETDAEASVGVERLRWAIDSMNTRVPMALEASGVEESDEMYLAVKNLFDDPTNGLATLLPKLDYMNDDEARGVLTNFLDKMSEQTFAAIALNRANAAVGEYAMTKLSALLGALLPQFERPEFIKQNLSPDGSVNMGEDDDKDGSHSGGLGEGATFGSDDYVLDPLTGEYVKFGDLINKYNALMFEKLEGDLYSEEQKQMIRKYFELLFGGLDEEGK